MYKRQVEGCCIPFDWKKDFTPACREQIRYVCLIFSEGTTLLGELAAIERQGIIDRLNSGRELYLSLIHI